MDMLSWLHLTLQQNCKKIGSTHHAKQGNLVAEIEAIEDLEVSVLFFSFSLFFSLIIHNCICFPTINCSQYLILEDIGGVGSLFQDVLANLKSTVWKECPIFYWSNSYCQLLVELIFSGTTIWNRLAC